MMMDVLPHSIGVWVSSIDAKHGKDAGKVAPFTKGQFIHPDVDERAKDIMCLFCRKILLCQPWEALSSRWPLQTSLA